MTLMDWSMIIKGVCSLGLIGLAFRYGEILAKKDHLIALIICTGIAIGVLWDADIISITMTK